MEFTLSEQLAIIKMIDSVIMADEIIHPGETTIFAQLIEHFGFESNFIYHAQNLDFDEGLLMLKEMPNYKKYELREILHNVSKADGFVHIKEIAMISKIFASIGVKTT